MRSILKNKTAQSIMEFSLIFAAVIAAVVLTGNYYRRSFNAKLKRTAIGLNQAFTNINDVSATVSGTARTGSSYNWPTEPTGPDPATQAAQALALLKNIINNGNLETGRNLLIQAQSAIASRDIAGAISLINQALAKLNGIDFSQLSAALNQMRNIDPSVAGLDQIRAGITQVGQAIASANAAIGYLQQAQSYLIQAAGYDTMAANYTSQAQQYPVGSSNYNRLMGLAQQAANNATTARNNATTAFNNAAAAVANAINSLNQAISSFNNGADALYNQGGGLNQS